MKIITKLTLGSVIALNIMSLCAADIGQQEFQDQTNERREAASALRHLLEDLRADANNTVSDEDDIYAPEYGTPTQAPNRSNSTTNARDRNNMTPEQLLALINGQPVHQHVLEQTTFHSEEPFYSRDLTAQELINRINGEPVHSIRSDRIDPEGITTIIENSYRNRMAKALMATIIYYMYMNAQHAQSGNVHQ